MKKHLTPILILTLFCITLTVKVKAQDCKNFIYMSNGKVIKYTSSNAKGKITTNMVYTITSKTGNKAKVQSQILDEKNKQISNAEIEMICNGNTLKMDMRNFMPSGSAAQFKGMSVKASAAYLNYPSKMQVGQQLPDGNFKLDMFNDSQKMAETSLNIADRKVQSAETITTPAGTFDCYKITYTTDIKTTTMGIGIPFKILVTEWYAIKLGLFVKSEASNKNGKIMSTTTLNSIN